MSLFDSDFAPKPLVENVDFYLDPRGFRVMTAKFLAQRGYCCGNGCRHCPYFPLHQKGNSELRDGYDQ